MNMVRYDFLNWNADLEDWEHEGLDKAQNVVHQAEGWLPMRIPSSGAFSTTLSLNYTSINSVRVAPFGNAGALAAAVINYATVSTTALRIGVIGESPFTTISFATLQSATAASLTSFSIAEVGQRVVISAIAEVTLAGGSTTTYNAGGTFTYTVTSV